MSISQSTYDYLSGNSTITGALASASAIFPHMMPQNYVAYPALTYSLDDETPVELLSGGVSDTKFATFELNVWSDSHTAAHDAASTIKTEMVGYSGTFGSHTAGLIRIIGEQSLYESDTRLYRVRMTLEITYCS